MAGGSASRRATLECVARQTGVQPQELLDVPPIPARLSYLWGYFCNELQGREPLTYLEIQAWSDLTGRHVASWEVSALKALDRIMWGTLAENEPDRTPRNPS